MICTQPRRISAMAVADRVSAERAEVVGQTVGYQIRLEAKRSRQTKLLFCTTGVLLRRLQGDCLLKGVSHIFVDEIHERDINSDFLLIILKKILAFRPSLKIILMSATLNAAMFAAYFDGCPIVSIPGRAHPVTALFLEDAIEHSGYTLEESSEYAKKNAQKGTGKGAGGAGGRNHQGLVKQQMQIEGFDHGDGMDSPAWWKRELPGYSTRTYDSLSRVAETDCKDSPINYELIIQLLEHICFNCGEGAVLVFMPGLAEITRLYEDISDEYGASSLARQGNVLIFPLHSSLTSSDQKLVFERPPNGKRKVVIATNIAETSITIDDVVYVIDACRMKENRWDAASGMASLTEDWVSKASARQRKGRAGRVQAGFCYHLVSSKKYESFQEYQLPEMLRVPLDGLILQIKLLGLGEPTDFLGMAIESPSSGAVEASLDLLRSLDAIDSSDDDQLTSLGYHLAALPVDVRIGKMLIFGAILGVTEPVLTMAAAMGFRSPFMAPIDKREEADKVRKAMGLMHSDHLTTLRAFDGWQAAKALGRREASSYCQQNFLSRNTLEMIEEMREQFRTLLAAIGFIPAGRDGYRKGGGYGHASRSANAGVKAKDADWICPKCNVNVFASKSVCFKCRQPKTVAVAAEGSNVATTTSGPRGNAVIEVGSRVMAKFYADGTMNLALVRGKVTRGGSVLLQCEFVGYEDDGVQDTHVRDCRLVGAGDPASAATLEPARPVVGSKVMAKFYEDGTMNPAIVRGCVVRGGLNMYQCEFVGYEDDGVQDTHVADVRMVQDLSAPSCVPAAPSCAPTAATAHTGVDGDRGGGAASAVMMAGGERPQDACERGKPIGSDHAEYYNRNCSNYHIVKAVICAGLYPNVIVVDKSKATPKLNSRKGEVFLHPACLDAGQETSLDSNILVYHEIVKTAKVYVRDATTISPYALLLFGGQIHVQHQSNKV